MPASAAYMTQQLAADDDSTSKALKEGQEKINSHCQKR
jgi:hypothetical protein